MASPSLSHPGSRSAVVDTSVLHAYIWNDDPLHEPAVALLSAVDVLVVPSIVVHELIWSTRKRKGREAARNAGERLLAGLNVRYEPVWEEDVVFALQDPRRYHDLLVVSTALRLKLPLATFDHEMAKLARRYGIPLLGPGYVHRFVGTGAEGRHGNKIITFNQNS